MLEEQLFWSSHIRPAAWRCGSRVAAESRIPGARFRRSKPVTPAPPQSMIVAREAPSPESTYICRRQVHVIVSNLEQPAEKRHEASQECDGGLLGRVRFGVHQPGQHPELMGFSPCPRKYPYQQSRKRSVCDPAITR